MCQGISAIDECRAQENFESLTEFLIFMPLHSIRCFPWKRMYPPLNFGLATELDGSEKIHT